MSTPISCPKCDCIGYASVIINHFHLDHPEYILYYGSTIAVDLNADNDENWFLYVDNERNLFSLATYTYDKIDDDFKIFTFDTQALSSKTDGVTQRVELYSVYNKLQWTSDDTICAENLTKENKQIIEVNVKDQEYPYNILLCRVFLTAGKNEILPPEKEQYVPLPQPKIEPLQFLEDILCPTLPQSDFANPPLSCSTPMPQVGSENSRNLTCTKCGITFKSGAGLASHLRAHNRANNVASLAGLASHNRSYNNQSTSSKEPNNIPATHEQTTNAYKCSQCGMQCKSGGGLASHMRMHDRNSNISSNSNTSTTKKNNVSGYKCTKCDKVCQSLTDLASHNRGHDINNNNSAALSKDTNISSPTKPSSSDLKCVQCGIVCQSGAGLASHMRAHERRTDSASIRLNQQRPDTSLKENLTRNSSGCSCSICGIICKSGAGLASHMRAHEKRADSALEQKNQQRPLNNLERYLSSNSSSFSCSICGMVCKSGAGLSSHMRAHERTKTMSNLFDSLSTNSGYIAGRISNYSNGGMSSYLGGYSSGLSMGGGGGGGMGGGGGLSCSECGRVCGSGAGLASHMRAHARRA